jgi:hypothetical protein
MEAPEPSLTNRSPLHEAIVKMRQQADLKIDPGHRGRSIHRRATVTGVGFAGLPDGRTPSGVRLYPLLSIVWDAPSGSAK